MVCRRQTTTPVPTSQPMTTASAPAAASTSSSAVIITTTVLAVVLVAVALLLLQRRRARHTRELLHALLELTPMLPPHCRQQADEEFNLRYANLLGSREACSNTFEALRVLPQELQPTKTVLGEGMFAHVLLARFCAPSTHVGWKAIGPQPEGEHSLVAVKELHISQGREAAVLTQVLLEARILAVLDHPHIVRLVGIRDSCLPLRLALEYCAEGNLRDFLRGGGEQHLLPAADAGCIALACQIAAAVHYLHNRLCIHRDLAARNILLQIAGGNGIRTVENRDHGRCGYIAKLADLGLARALRREEDYYRVSPVTGASDENEPQHERRGENDTRRMML